MEDLLTSLTALFWFESISFEISGTTGEEEEEESALLSAGEFVDAEEELGEHSAGARLGEVVGEIRGSVREEMAGDVVVVMLS